MDGLAHLGKKKGILTVVDSTFASPYNQKPILHGIDVVVHSGTSKCITPHLSDFSEYMGGHSDILCGAIITKTESLWEQIMCKFKLFGGVLDPFQSFLLERGLKTLALRYLFHLLFTHISRMEAHNSNALEVARFLESHPKVEFVQYPGLESHPQHEIAKRQMKGFGGTLAFEVKGGEESGKTLVESVKLINLAVSLGGVESLVEHVRL